MLMACTRWQIRGMRWAVIAPLLLGLSLADEGPAPPPPLLASRHFITQTEGAACLDGTPPAYWLVKGAEQTK